MILPQPWLAAWLRAALDNDLSAGLVACGQVICNPFQRWGVQRALRQQLSAEPDQVYPTFDLLLREPMPYRTPGLGRSDELARMRQSDFTTRLIIGELAGRSPIPGVSNRLARFATNWWRDRRPSPLTELARVYYQLLVEETWDSQALKALEPLGYTLTAKRRIRLFEHWMLFSNARPCAP
ncbi:MAG: hypothetical protein KA765_15335 [Thermoflexales bacterium]|nr:hypothetical protein [Thermoflexales bacterium]